MNVRAVAFIAGCVLLILGIALLVPAGIGLALGEREAAVACGLASLATLSGGAIPAIALRSSLQRAGRPNFFRREGMAAVGLTWVLVGLFGALPYVFSGVLPEFSDALFESVSGFTTTGATVMDGHTIDSMPTALHFWRMETNWLGGVGIVMLFVLIMPTGGRSLYRAEVTGYDREASTNRVRDSAKNVFAIYLALTLSAFVYLLFQGVGALDAFMHAMATIATGGFSTHSASIGHFDSAPIELGIVLFMFLAGVNFGLYDQLRRSKPARWLKIFTGSTEFRWYFFIVVGSTLLVAFGLWLSADNAVTSDPSLPDYRNATRSLRDGLFGVVTMQTCCGFATADFDRWPDFCRYIVMFSAVIGGCAGSTAGGIKIIRIVLVSKLIKQAIFDVSNPREVKATHLDGETVPESALANAGIYLGMWVFTFIGATMIASCSGIDLISSASGVVATLNNAGPGLALLGPASNFGDLEPWLKYFFTLLMLVGRLEFYALVTLFLPRFWKS